MLQHQKRVSLVVVVRRRRYGAMHASEIRQRVGVDLSDGSGSWDLLLPCVVCSCVSFKKKVCSCVGTPTA
jgi:hypothetical protein